MSAGFKKSPISTRSFNRGFKIFKNVLLRPTLRVGSTVIKSSLKSQPNTSRVTTPVSKGTYGSPLQETSKTYTPASISPIFEIRQKGIEQCKQIHDLYFNAARPDCLASIEGVLSKFLTASNQYLSKGTKCGYDCYTFTQSFFASQIENVKKETTRNEYRIALEVLPLLASGKSSEEILEAIKMQLEMESVDGI